MFNNLQELDNLSCEIIENFNRFGIYDYYGIILPDKYYSSLDGWLKPKNPYDYICYNEVIWNDKFNMILEADTHTMFHYDPDSIYEIYGEHQKKEAKEFIRCYALLRRIFRRYNFEWNFINQGFGLTFRDKKHYLDFQEINI
ncbi:hypothetical protein ACUH7Y_09725 [Clostridium beijerinckii]|uniref:Uncharacterized protein n=1 Tax=Clostridium beijerinckii TaxID=1520 RepID=A0A7X9SME1_CLOBE|nr:hypothetical protein [Clostridium beijerinckii]NMF04590.1 hypothetical protein [Clostridium beijerinckii]